MTLWLLTSAGGTAPVDADDQWAAFDTLKDEPLENFGLLVSASTDLSPGNTYGVRTSLLLARWGRIEDARTVIDRVIAAGGPDTSAEDLPAAPPPGPDA